MLKRIVRSRPKSETRSPRGAFREVFEAEEASLLRFAISMVRQREVAEEIVQDVFLKLHLKWEEVEQPRAWLYRSVRNGILNHLRDERVFSRDPSEIESGLAETECMEQDQLTRLEAIQVVRGLLDSLPEDDRKLLHLKYFQGMRYREISEQTGLSVGNVGYRLHHLLHRLAKKLHSLRMD